MRRLLSLVIPSSLLALVGLVPAAQAAQHYYLNISGMDGNATAPGWTKASDVDAFSFSGSMGEATRSKAPSVNLSDFSVTKDYDRTSPMLFQKMAAGQVISSMKFSIVDVNPGAVPTVQFCMLNVRLRSAGYSGSAGGPSSPTEADSFSFDTVIQRYQRTNDDNQPEGAPVFGGWNVVQNMAAPTFPSNCGD